MNFCTLICIIDCDIIVRICIVVCAMQWLYLHVWHNLKKINMHVNIVSSTNKRLSLSCCLFCALWNGLQGLLITNKCRRIKFIVQYTVCRILHLLTLIEWVVKYIQFFSQFMYLEDIWIRMWVWNKHIIGLIILGFRELQFIFQFFSYSRRTQGWWQGSSTGIV
jgi:hypothetical protein